MRRTLILLIAIALFSPVLGAQPARRANANANADNGFSGERLRRADAFLQEQVDSGRIAGAVGLVLRDGKTVYERAVGWADKESKRPMTVDAMFRIASQTKALTSIAVMILFEEGRIALSNPVSRFIPAYARTTVMMSGQPVRAARQITIKDLLTHTAGISYGTDSALATLYREKGLGPAAGAGWYTADKDEGVCTTMERLAALPFLQQPGKEWVYGYSTDILGCVVEKVSGMQNGGVLDGTRILSPRTVALMTSNQSGTLYPSNGQSFGLGFSIVERLGADNTAWSVGTYGWGGAYGSQYRVDPKEGVVLVFMINQMPNRPDAASKFPNLVYQALMTSRN